MASQKPVPSLFKLPVLTVFPFSLDTAYTVLHFVGETCYQDSLSVQQKYDEEKAGLQSKFQLVHLYVGGSPFDCGKWLGGVKTTAKIAWIGPGADNRVRFDGEKITNLPFFLVYEGRRVIYAGKSLEYPFAGLPARCIARNLAECAQSAVSLHPRDAGGAVICGGIVRDIVRSLPLPEPVDVITEQTRLIESLKAEVERREREIAELREIAHLPQKATISPRTLPPLLRPYEPNSYGFPVLTPRSSIPSFKLSEQSGQIGDFWTSIEDESESLSPMDQQNQFQELVETKGLWITKADQQQSGQKGTVGGVPSQSTFFEQRQRYNESLKGKQPLAKDVKPLPSTKINSVRSLKKLTPRTTAFLSVGESITSPRHASKP